MVRIPCWNCGMSIDLEPIEILSGYDTLCKDCKCYIEADKRGKKIDKLLKRSIWRKIRDFVGV